MRHDCMPGTENGRHIFPSDAYGGAIEFCEENEKGELWCGNGEYATRVNFCPFCGYAAPQQVEWKPPDVEDGMR